MKRKSSFCLECAMERTESGTVCDYCNRYRFDDYNKDEMIFAINHLQKGFPVDLLGFIYEYIFWNISMDKETKLLIPKLFIFGKARYNRKAPTLLDLSRLVIRENLKENLVNNENDKYLKHFVEYSNDIPRIVTDYINFKDFWIYYKFLCESYDI